MDKQEYLDVSKCTPGPAVSREDGNRPLAGCGRYLVMVPPEYTVVAQVPVPIHDLPWPQVQALANVDLIAEAFTVATETGKSPRQLAEENERLARQVDLYWELSTIQDDLWSKYQIGPNPVGPLRRMQAIRAELAALAERKD